MKVVWTEEDVAEVVDDHNQTVADAVRDDLTTLAEQLDGVDRKVRVRQRMDTVWRNFVGERYIHPQDRSFRTIYIITGYGVVYYGVIKKRKDKQDALFRSFEGNRKQVIKDAELKIAELQQTSEHTHEGDPQ